MFDQPPDQPYRLDYTQQQMPVTLPENASAEQTMDMSPMDLFDSIFWGKFFIFCQLQSGD
jgi:hypothetical protein